MTKKVLIIVPCFNEEASLPFVLQEINKIELPDNYNLNILVVNDCSVDGTKTVAEAAGVLLLDLPVNLGIGGAVQSGMVYALENNYDIAVQMDGDGQHPPDQFIKLINYHESTDANVVIGSRFIENEGYQSSFFRRLGIGYFYCLNYLFTGKRIYDSTSGYRLFDRTAINIGAKCYPDDYPEPESLVLFSKAGLTIKEVPVIMHHRYGGQSSIRNFASLYYCIKVSIAMFFSFIRKTS
jgi:glycosyltransferase involved in cell wall biosynthesis